VLEYILGYFAVGVVICGLLYKSFEIKWGHEDQRTKALVLMTPFIWPYILFMLARDFMK